LRRMIRPQGDQVVENPITSSRAVRLALTKSANDSIGLALTVSSVAEAESTLDDALSDLDDTLLLVGLLRDARCVGLAILDQEMRAAAVEMQTVGALISQKAAARPPTHTDGFLCQSLLDQFLTAFPEAVRGTSLDGWGDDVRPDTRVPDLRTAGLILADGRYRSVQMTVELGVADRQGVLQILLPMTELSAPPHAVKTAPVDWHKEFRDGVMDARPSMEAILHRFTVPFATVRGMRVGDEIPLPGCTVASVKLVAGNGAPVALGKLGQMGGMRAIRIEAPPAPEMSDLAANHAPPQADVLLPDPGIDMPVEASQADIHAEVGEMDVEAMDLSEGFPTALPDEGTD